MRILRTLSGAVFILSLAVFVATTFIRYGVLRESAWFSALEKSQVTQQFEELVVATREKQAGAEAAATVRNNLNLEELQVLLKSNFSAALRFVRGEADELQFDFAQAGTFDITGAAQQNPQVGEMLRAVRIGYKTIVIIEIISGIVALLALGGVYAAGERGRRLGPLAKLVGAGGVLTLFGAGVVWVIGKKIARGAQFPVDVAGERVYFDLADLVQAVLVQLTTPIIGTGLALGVAGGVLLMVARRSEPKTSVVTAPPVWRKKLGKKAWLGLALGAVVILTGAVYLNKGWETYRSEEFGYRVSHPRDWKVDDSASSGTNRETTVVHPDGLAFVTIRAIKDDSLQEPGAVEATLKERVDGFAQQPDMTVTDSSARVEGDVGGYMVEGTEVVQGKTWNFHERGLLSRNGRVLLFHGSANPSLGDYRKTLIQIIESFKLE